MTIGVHDQGRSPVPVDATLLPEHRWQLVAPGLGDRWFSRDYAPGARHHDERVKYLPTEALPLLEFTPQRPVLGAGRPTRRAGTGPR
ncbi:hypothetical protein AB0O75_46900 [Streptomyces sp. NPDC088921]|uniref:hypothetical protein n=1 Tax=unclassified Streptomyces TaxID=2593676 RepID=UPI003436FF75